ncbi:hypothetical protein BJV78DRAFT_1129912, partial [Lactifluus subvellereus]
IVADATTCRRHCESKHPGKYRNWCNKVGFKSKLPGDIAARKLKATETQRTLDGLLVEKKLADRTVPYSDELFRQAVIEWLVATDQPIQAFEHPKFKEMIDIASRATNGVKIPGREATHAEIKGMFKKHLTSLKSRLNVSLICCHTICKTDDMLNVYRVPL